MDKHLTRKISSFGILTAALAMSVGHGVALADIPGYHPAYLHARSDLRRAERLLHTDSNSNNPRILQAADYEIDAAIREIDRAAVIDRKDIDDNPQVDTSLNRRGRLRRVVELLQRAHQDLGETETNGYAQRWRNRAEYHVNKAIELTNRAIQDYASDREYHRY
jgi:hypothetical protein